MAKKKTTGSKPQKFADRARWGPTKPDFFAFLGDLKNQRARSDMRENA